MSKCVMLSLVSDQPMPNLFSCAERQIRDIRGILASQMSKIDFPALNERIDAQDLRSCWDEEIVPWLEANR